METVKLILTIIQLIAGVALIVIIMFQSGKEAGLSGALTGNTDNYMSKSKFGNLDKTLASATKWIALVWVVLTLLLSVIPF